jgi:transcriptional regulator with XRE-family HTH domain
MNCLLDEKKIKKMIEEKRLTLQEFADDRGISLKRLNCLFKVMELNLEMDERFLYLMRNGLNCEEEDILIEKREEGKELLEVDYIYHLMRDPHELFDGYRDGYPNGIYLGLEILKKYLHKKESNVGYPELISKMEEKSIFSVSVKEISEAGITEEDVWKLFLLGWEIDNKIEWELDNKKQDGVLVFYRLTKEDKIKLEELTNRMYEATEYDDGDYPRKDGLGEEIFDKYFDEKVILEADRGHVCNVTLKELVQAGITRGDVMTLTCHGWRLPVPNLDNKIVL